MTETQPPREKAAFPATRFVQRNPVSTAILIILAIGFIDLEIEPQLSSTFFYLLPVLLVSRHAGLPASVGCAALATAMSLVANLATSHPDTYPLIPFSDAILRFGVLLVVVQLVRSLRKVNDTLDERVKDRTARLQAEVKERLKLERRIIEARESEQARIGQDLHDGLCQLLVATSFSAGRLQRSLEKDHPPDARTASEIVGMLDESISLARDLAKGLYPVPLEEEGVETALRDLAAKTTRRTGIPCLVEISGPPSRLPKDAAIHLYRIAQEALNNASKHADATAMKLCFAADDRGFELTIEDNGRGLEGGTRNSGGMGLHIMEYRARTISAALDVAKGKAGGTLVRCVSTCPNDAHE